MIRRLYPARLSGTVSVPDSKSAWHRALICRFLAGQPLPDHLSGDDVSATLNGLLALQRGESVIDCGASGATLRFLLPLAMALDYTGVCFTGPACWRGPCPPPIRWRRRRRAMRLPSRCGRVVMPCGATRRPRPSADC